MPIDFDDYDWARAAVTALLLKAMRSAALQLETRAAAILAGACVLRRWPL